MDTPWKPPISSSTWAALSTPLYTPTLTFFDESASHHRWWVASWTEFGARIGWALLLSWGFTLQSCVLAVGLHGAETWTLLKEDSRRLHAFHVTCQRRILGVRWNDFVTNRAVADSTNLPSILSTIAARRHCFFRHIRSLSANTPAHKALKLAVDSKSGEIPQHDWNRPAGRPRTTWMSQIVRDTGLTAADAWALADDRSTWRALRPTAGYAQQWVSEW